MSTDAGFESGGFAGDVSSATDAVEAEGEAMSPETPIDFAADAASIADLPLEERARALQAAYERLLAETQGSSSGAGV